VASYIAPGWLHKLHTLLMMVIVCCNSSLRRFIGQLCSELATVSVLVFATQMVPGGNSAHASKGEAAVVDNRNRGLYYAVFLSFLDIGDSISDWITAPIVGLLGLVWTNFSSVSSKQCPFTCGCCCCMPHNTALACNLQPATCDAHLKSATDSFVPWYSNCGQESNFLICGLVVSISTIIRGSDNFHARPCCCSLWH